MCRGGGGRGVVGEGSVCESLFAQTLIDPWPWWRPSCLYSKHCKVAVPV